jgi:hypothetical protein
LKIWPPLISAAKERHEKLGRTKKALDELIETEKEIKEKLSILNEELATVKLAEKVENNFGIFHHFCC